MRLKFASTIVGVGSSPASVISPNHFFKFFFGVRFAVLASSVICTQAKCTKKVEFKKLIMFLFYFSVNKDHTLMDIPDFTAYFYRNDTFQYVHHRNLFSQNGRSDFVCVLQAWCAESDVEVYVLTKNDDVKLDVAITIASFFPTVFFFQ